MTKKKELEVLWKVVDANRKSIVINRKSTSSDTRKNFALAYKPGTVVKAKRGSYGCFCFKTRLYARNYNVQEYGSMIVRVIPRGKIKPTPKYVPEVRFNSLKDLKKEIRSFKLCTIPPAIAWPVPDGTVCCTSVEVLD